MSKKERITFLPRLRFPEFSSTGGWDRFTLEKVADRITEKVGDKQLVTLSISAGTGFVSQAEKFSRDISGKQYHNYISLRKGDFSYNKGNSKAFPQGCIYELLEYDEAAVPNAFISFHFKDAYVPKFYKGYFENNFHGKQLKKFITSGARMDGLLNIKPSDFFSIVLPTPKDKEEQQKIADCLSSLDDLIVAEDKKLSALRDHKKGLMQKLFPAEGETVPEWRFPEFRDGGEWERKALKDISPAIFDGTHQTPKYTAQGVPFYSVENVVSGNKNKFTSREDYLIATGKNRPEKGDIIVTRIGKIGFSVIVDWDFEFSIYVTLAVIKKSKEFHSHFLHCYLQSEAYQSEICNKSLLNAVPCKINMEELRKTHVLLPKNSKEQLKISDCFSALDKLIIAQTEKIEALYVHKKGLMQGLFPSIEEVEA